MVDHFESCEFWLPLELLTDEDFAFNSKQSEVDKLEEIKCGSDSFGSSGTNSDTGSTESESDEDDYITGVTHKLPNSTLKQNCSENNIIEFYDIQAYRLPTSPKSPLCKASSELRRRQMVQESVELLQSRNEVHVPVEQPRPKFGYLTNHPPQLSYQQLPAIRFEQIRRQQMFNQTQQNIGVKIGEKMPIGLPYPARPPLQGSQSGTGVNAVYLGNNLGTAKKQCAGTGVFLPRTLSSIENSKNKPASTPVSIPDRVVQPLNMNMETLAVRNQAHRYPGYSNNNGFPAKNGTSALNNKMKTTNHIKAQQPLSIARVEPENPEVNRLPPEWTY